MKANNVRPPAVAGMFYPASSKELRDDVFSYIRHGHRPSLPCAPKAIIAPHAGYMYSGPIAGSAYCCLQDLRSIITRVILLGPSHRVAFRGIAGTSAAAFRTPLGDVNVDREALDGLGDLPFVTTLDPAHRDEHSLEVHIPFLQVALESFAIVPLVVGDATGKQVATVMERLWGGNETLFVVSSDLSHYLRYDDACRIDRATSVAIEKLDPSAIDFNQACGRIPVQGLLLEAARHKLTATTADLRNSGDTAGDKDQVVGYGAYVFT